MVYSAEFGIFVDCGDDASQCGIRCHTVRFARDVPLADDMTRQAQFDDRAVEIAVGAGLALWPDTILESYEEVVAKPRNVIRIAQRLRLAGGRSGGNECVMERRALQHDGHMERSQTWSGSRVRSSGDAQKPQGSKAGYTQHR